MRRSRAAVAVGLLALAALAHRCDDFLDAPPKGRLDALTLANRDGVEATLIGAYAMLDGYVPGLVGVGRGGEQLAVRQRAVG